MTFKVLLEKKVKKQINNLLQEKSKILQELEKGFSSNIKKLKETKNHYRIRVGTYRILFLLEFDTVFVYDVIHRGQACK